MTEEYKEFKQYVQDHNIVEMKKQELKNMLDKHELEAMKLIYGTDNNFADDDISKLVKKQIKESRKLVLDASHWNLGFCLLSHQHEFI